MNHKHVVYLDYQRSGYSKKNTGMKDENIILSQLLEEVIIIKKIDAFQIIKIAI